MILTKTLFNGRKDEIEFYFEILSDIIKPEAVTDRQKAEIKTKDNGRFIRISKSNFLVMLYNLIESCVKSGFEEIYEVLKSENISYVQASYALRDIWSNHEISKAHQSTANRETYGKRVKNILDHVISNAPVALSKKVIETMASGNLDARKIRELLEKHDIGFTETHNGGKPHMLTVKNKRNSLAHGEESFDEAARDLTIEDLEKIKNEVLVFIEDALSGIETYYNDRLYLTPQATESNLD